VKPKPAAVVVLLLLASCASDWKFVASTRHPALRDGAEIATFERGRGDEYQRRDEIRSGGADHEATSVEELIDYVRPIDCGEAAIAYGDLVRRVGAADSGARGLLVVPDASIAGSGGSGRYSRADAAGWGVPFERAARPNAGGYQVDRVVLHPPVAHAVLPGVFTPWRLVLLSEIVFPDGTLRYIGETTLTNGSDASRFATR
jgi:hypothetical protein